MGASRWEHAEHPGEGRGFPCRRRGGVHMSARGSAASPDATRPSGARHGTGSGSRSTGGGASTTNGAADAPVQEQASSIAPAPPAPEGGAAAPRDWAWGAIVVMAGLFAIVAVFVFAVLEYK